MSTNLKCECGAYYEPTMCPVCQEERWIEEINSLRARIAELEAERLRFYHADGTFEILASPEEVMERRVGCAIQIKDLKHALLVCHADANRALLSGIRGDYQDALLTIRLTADNAIG